MERYAVIGKSLPRQDSPTKATGEIKYTDDIALPGLLTGKILRSPYAHAKILNVDPSKALRLAGVKAVVTGKDTPGIKYGTIEQPGIPADRHPIPMDKVRYVGEGVAAVAAIDEDVATEALELIHVDYEELPALLSPEEAMKSEAPRIHDHAENNITTKLRYNFGDVEKGFSESDYIREDRFLTQFQNHSYMEPHASLANFDSSGKLTVWASTQFPFELRRGLAITLNMPENMIRVIKPAMGGGFGGKVEMQPSHFCSAFLSLKAGRPVKIIETREEILTTALRRHSCMMNLKTGVKKDGTLVAFDCNYVLDGGAYTSVGPMTVFLVGIFLATPYRLQHLRCSGLRVYTNKPPCGPMRGHGIPQSHFFSESHLDMIAEDLGLDPVELRLKNALRPGDTAIPGWRIGTCGFSEAMQRIVEKTNFRARHRKMDKNQGIGLASYGCVSGVNVPPNVAFGATVEVRAGGGITLFTGAADIGQGMELGLAQIAAEELGVKMEDVKVIAGDTEICPPAHGSFSRKGLFYAGNAVKSAASAAKKQLLEGAAKQLEANPEDLEMKEGKIYVKGSPEKGMSFTQAILATQASRGWETISGRGFYHPPVGPPNFMTGKGNLSPAYTFGSQVAEIEIDAETGKVNIKKVTVAHDCGFAINPISVEGQIEGGVSFMVGQTLTEEFYEDRGLTLNASLLDYKIPTSMDMPSVDSILVETDEPAGPFGAKEGGEGAALAGPPVIANAIYDALKVRIKELPITPERILEALSDK